MGLDGFYLSYASRRLPSLPSLLLSPSVRHVMKHYSPEFHSCVLFQCALLQGGTGVYVMQMCRGYPCAHDIASALWKTPQTPVIKSTSASNNNVLHLTLCSENMWEKNPPNTSQFKKKTPIGHQVVSGADEPASLCHLPYVAFIQEAFMKKK